MGLVFLTRQGRTRILNLDNLDFFYKKKTPGWDNVLDTWVIIFTSFV